MELPDLDRVFVETRGVVTLRMLVDRGCPHRRTRRWVESGDIVRVCGQAFVRRGRAVTLVERVIAARLTWPDAIICFVTAALLHGFAVEDDGLVHVLVPSMRRPLPGIRPHFWSVRPTDVVVRDTIVVTDRRTTLADCLGRLDDDVAWGLLAWMFTREQITAQDVDSQIGLRHSMYGIVRLRVMAAALRRGAVSKPEVQLQEFLEEHGFTGWSANAAIRLDGRVIARADVAFPAWRLSIEYDGVAAHGADRRERDLRRTLAVRAAGYVELRVRWVPLNSRRRLLRDTIRALLAEDDDARRAAIADAWNGARYRTLAELLAPGLASG